MKKSRTLSRSVTQRGLSLVELLIAMTLGVLLAVALVQSYLASRGVFGMQDSVSRLQEGGRFALGYVSEDVRMAGFVGCPSIDRVFFFSDHASSGFDSDTIIRSQNNVAAGNARGAIPGSDVLIIRKAVGEGRPVMAASGSGDDAELQVGGGAAVAEGTLLIVSNCISTDIFSTVGNSSTSGTPPTTTVTANRLTDTYGIDAEVFGYEVIEYFVADTGRGTRALFVDRSGDVQELVEGVENLQIEFGLDSSGNDRAADSYDAAPTNWNQVVSVRINMLLQSNSDTVIPSSGEQAQSIQFMGNDVVADGRLRQVFSSTVAIRNRLP